MRLLSVVRSARGARAPPCARARPRMGGTQIPRSAPQLRATAQAECMCCCTWRGGELERRCDEPRSTPLTPRPERGVELKQGHHAHARALPTRVSTGAACVSTLGLRVYREARDGLSPSFPAAPDLFRLCVLAMLSVACAWAAPRRSHGRRARLWSPGCTPPGTIDFRRARLSALGAPSGPAREEPEP